MDLKDHYTIDDLLTIMARLRAPEGGCPWDLEQDFDSIAPYTIEEAYEVAEAIREKDMPQLRDELGDLLFQSVYHAQMASEDGAFNFDDVVKSICDKMIRRHPHVFGEAQIHSADHQTEAWEELKAKERAAKADQADRLVSILDDVPVGLPALLRAVKLQKRAARVGFDWPEAVQVLDKLVEEVAELQAEVAAETMDTEKVADEFGDVLFVLANLARHLKIDPEEALRRTNHKFIRRFHFIEQQCQKEGTPPETLSLHELDDFWDMAKQHGL